MIIRFLPLLAVFSAALSAAGSAQTPSPPQPRLQAAAPVTIMIATGDIETTEAKIVTEMARTLSEPGLRIIPVVGQGSVQHVSDLLNIRTIDAAVIQSDVLAQFKKTQRVPLIQNKLQYITKLYTQEFHVLSRMQFTCLADLEGRKVSFGALGSGSALTAELVFGAHNVKPQPLYLEQDSAFAKLKNGEIDAVVFVGGKPAPVFVPLKYTDKIHFLDVDYIEPLQQDYLPGVMTHDDYPNLIAPNETVSTVSVAAVLAMAGHRSQSEQFRRMSAFANKFLANISKFKGPEHHEKWQEVAIQSPLPGWTRFPAAQSWLDANAAKFAKTEAREKTAAAVAGSQTTLSAQAPAQSPDQVRAMLKQFLQTQSGESADREELFNQFVRWYEKQKP